MKIAIFSTPDSGGAGKAALRLHNGLNQIGEDSTLFVKWKTVNNNTIVQLQSPEINNRIFEKCVLDQFMSNVYDGNTMCSAMYPSIGFNYLKRIEDFDIVNLHWISTFISLESIEKIRKMGKPIVWTLHDQNPMTGACHYTHGCQKYKEECSNCVQLKSNKYNIAQTILKAKLKYLPKDIVIVTPSRWLADCAKQSAVFRNHRIEVIPNSLETDIYRPIDKKRAKSNLGFSASTRVILFGAQDLKERRKGFVELVDIVKHIRENEFISGLIRRNELNIVTFGHCSPLLDSMRIPYKSLGYIDDEQLLRTIYSAADVLALPSLEDNLPNLMLESLACGTPVVAFAVGGMLDIIQDRKNGFLVPIKDTKVFAERISETLNGCSMEAYCRSFAEENFRLEVQAKRYRQLFQELFDQIKSTAVQVTEVPPLYPEIASAMATVICEASTALQVELDGAEIEQNRLREENRQLQAKVNQLQNEIVRLEAERTPIGILCDRMWKKLRNVITI
ncbi:D-inositol-3-phosphate glycosyltransferase [Sporomusa carbonis]|uniref:glycosyltransferase n=1 Tax=Sporomusa carbonis TaxID=3076075 RepID=UPI003A5E3B1A